MQRGRKVDGKYTHGPTKKQLPKFTLALNKRATQNLKVSKDVFFENLDSLLLKWFSLLLTIVISS